MTNFSHGRENDTTDATNSKREVKLLQTIHNLDEIGKFLKSRNYKNEPKTK